MATSPLKHQTTQLGARKPHVNIATAVMTIWSRMRYQVWLLAVASLLTAGFRTVIIHEGKQGHKKDEVSPIVTWLLSFCGEVNNGELPFCQSHKPHLAAASLDSG